MKTLSLIIFGMALAISPAMSDELKDDTGSSMRDLREFRSEKTAPKPEPKNPPQATKPPKIEIPPDFPLDPFSAICGCVEDYTRAVNTLTR